jgi:lipocalin
MIFKTIFTTTTLLLTSPILFTSAQEVDVVCNKTITTVENFDIVSYTSAPWYVHQQAQNVYTPIERNYCTKAEYTLKDNPTFPWGYTVGVYNTAEYESGVTVEGNLCAYQTEESDSKLAVAPCWLPKQFAGPYWIIAYNETEGYALISGGQPTIVGENGLCRTGTGINNSGLWIFTRSQIRDEALITKVRSIAEEIGFDTSILNDVDQSSCDVCVDNGGSFDAGWFGEKTCDWVGKSTWWRCFFYGGECPLTCGLC